MIRKATTKRTVVEPISAGSTVGKSRRKLVQDCIELPDLGCHAFKGSPATSTATRYSLTK